MRFKDARRLVRHNERTRIARLVCTTPGCVRHGKWSFGQAGKEYLCAHCLRPVEEKR